MSFPSKLPSPTVNGESSLANTANGIFFPNPIPTFLQATLRKRKDQLRKARKYRVHKQFWHEYQRGFANFQGRWVRIAKPNQVSLNWPWGCLGGRHRLLRVVKRGWRR